MKKGKRAKIVKEAITLTWESLESHLPYCYGKSDDRKFHKQCVKDYAHTIELLSKLY